MLIHLLLEKKSYLHGLKIKLICLIAISSLKDLLYNYLFRLGGPLWINNACTFLYMNWWSWTKVNFRQVWHTLFFHVLRPNISPLCTSTLLSISRLSLSRGSNKWRNGKQPIKLFNVQVTQSPSHSDAWCQLLQSNQLKIFIN